jgi:hypothetical protein
LVGGRSGIEASSVSIIAGKDTEMDQPANTNDRESPEPDKQELTPEELDQLSGGGSRLYEPPDPC